MWSQPSHIVWLQQVFQDCLKVFSFLKKVCSTSVYTKKVFGPSVCVKNVFRPKCLHNSKTFLAHNSIEPWCPFSHRPACARVSYLEAAESDLRRYWHILLEHKWHYVYIYISMFKSVVDGKGVAALHTLLCFWHRLFIYVLLCCPSGHFSHGKCGSLSPSLH